MKFPYLCLLTGLTATAVQAETEDLGKMVISADFRPAIALQTPVSLSVFDEEQIESRGAQHLEDVLNLAPNVNISSGASRGQYYQIRGMGERSQFSAPINPSVGLIIDGIDYSRIGGAATLFDIETVEVLRGPQGTKYGTNALAGVINMQSNPPTEEFDLHIEAGVAEYDTYNTGLAVGGSLIDNQLLGRFAVYSHQSDGYMNNSFLGRDDTMARDEITARGQLRWLVSEDLTVDLNFLHLSLHNGYDAFTLDNSRNSLADEPGQDNQNTNAIGVRTDWRASSAVQIQTAFNYVNSDALYSYDADWTYDGIHPWGYVATESFQRARENYALELKALSNEDGRIFNDTTDWALGVYFLSQDEDLNLVSPWNPLVNQYETDNLAVFGQLDTVLNDKLTLISGLRVERFKADYQDSNNLEIQTSETLYGGKLGLNYQINDDHMAYGSLSRGYKSGGVNNGDSLPIEKRHFDTEYMWSLESGLKSLWLEGDLATNFSAFYSWRRDAQVKNSVFVGGGEFEDAIANAARGRHIGVEADMDWQLNQRLRLQAAVGLLHAVFDDYDDPSLPDNPIEGRRMAHAPTYQFTVGAEYALAPGWLLRGNVEGKNEFYYSNSHDSKSSAYTITNASLEYKQNNWKAVLWGKNLFDEDYFTRGFYFGNDPRDGYINHTYTQFGDPRVIGLTVSYDY